MKWSEMTKQRYDFGDYVEDLSVEPAKVHLRIFLGKI